ncbi:hypothetical protein [Collimonas arenae]|uniref:hypothetical protein n=1 Tax=Collimonas arenae TaxID=279058 RepID=UPI0012E8A6C9|nr:hypothetical protein [Collimonas arenae]
MNETAFRNVGNSLADPQASRAGVAVIHWAGTPGRRQPDVIEGNRSISWRIS